MEANLVTRSLNLAPSPVVPSDTVASRQVQEETTEAAKVTPPPPSGEGGSSGQPGLGDHVDLYDTQASKVAAEKAAQSGAQEKAKSSVPAGKSVETKPAKKPEIIGKDAAFPEPSEVPPEPEFPYLSPLGGQTGKQPGQSFDATA